MEKNELIQYANNHTIDEVQNYFNISNYQLKQFCKLYELNYSQLFKFINFKELFKTITKEEFETFYMSHSRVETQQYFRIGSSVFNKFVQYYNIIKSETAIDKIRKNTVLKKYGVAPVTQLAENKEKVAETKLSKYGSKNYVNIEQALQTREQRYGSISYHNIEKQKKTMLNKYGVEFALQSEQFSQKRRETLISKYNDLTYHNIVQMKKTNLDTIGVEFNFASKDPKLNGRETQQKIYQDTGIWNNRPKAIATCKEKYGDDFYIKQIDLMTSSLMSRSNSKINDDFYDLLISMGIIPQQREYNINNFWYDFKLGNYLIELDPYATHNSSWGIFNNPKSPDYHRNKTLNALEAGYKCIHIFDWMSVEPLIYHIINKDLDIIDTGKSVKHIFDTKTKHLTNTESDDTVIIYDDGFNIIY